MLGALVLAAALALQSGDGDEVKLSSDLVLVPVSVQREEGGAVLDLKPTEFALAEDGAAREVAFFERDALPLDVVLLVDASQSVEVSRGAIERAAAGFVKQLRPEDRVSVVVFADRPVIALDWSADFKQVPASLRRLEAGGGTALYGAVVAALHERFDGRPPERRRALVVLTDGVDNLSSVTSRTAAQAALRRDVTVYAVSTARILDAVLRAAADGAPSLASRKRERARLDELHRAEEPLSRLTDATGGRCIYAREAGDLPRAYGEVAGEMRSRYLLGYYPAPDAADGYHTISVTAKRPGLRVRARAGYFKE